MKSENSSKGYKVEKKRPGIFSLIIIALACLIFLYLSIGNLITFINNNVRAYIGILREYDFFIKVLLSIVLVFVYIKKYRKRSDLFPLVGIGYW
ncbi:hypothetical protein LX64_01436 [Chitinophaga skermanii]|uniref:Uncharacterized protein n=1 Tax=Chitinophaga skermanii TaxID=331697 RepID=A0A327QYT3_9BACT|nr:hypothetical protein [Chitinophaga skermanii]RAJ08782.1 hypothetical protein LX64_01436 [Chitinophaga skermanii]